ncbi:MAG: amylo-alpha-1,6-glucosidase [Thermoplasmataceae archaeon]
MTPNPNLTEQLKMLKSPEGWLYAGLPKFRAIFGRDSIISSMEYLGEDNSIAVSTLSALMRLQGKTYDPVNMEEPGKIIHENQTDPELIGSRTRTVPWLRSGRNYFSVDSTPLYVILAGMLYSADREAVSPEIGRSVITALSWIVKDGMNGSFLSYRKPPQDSGLQSQSWRDGIGSILEQMKSPVSVIGVQGYAYLALSKAKDLLSKEFLEDYSTLLESVDEAMNFLHENVYDFFSLYDENYLGLAIDGDGVLNQAITSDPGHLLFSGVLTRSQQESIVGRLFEPDLMTDYGIRCLSSEDRNFDPRAYQRGSVWPHDNWIIAIGLKECGYNKEYKMLRDRLISASQLLGGLPEYFGVSPDGRILPTSRMRIKPCFPQAWSTGALHYFTSHEK